MNELWRDLKIGDQVRVLAWPPEMHRDRLHIDSQDFLQWLIDTQSILTVTEIDPWGLPYGHIVRTIDGREQFEYWGLNHGEIEIV